MEQTARKGLLVCGALLAGLALSTAANQSKDAVHAASNNNQVVLVDGSNGSGVSDGNHFATSTWSALERGQRALDDPALVGQGLNTKQSLDGLKQDAVKSIKAYAQKGDAYLDAQNLNDSEKAALQKQNNDVVMTAENNIDQAHSAKAVLSALKAGAYGVLINSSSTTVNNSKDNGEAQNSVSKFVGNNDTSKVTNGDLNNVVSSDTNKVDQLDQELEDLQNELTSHNTVSGSSQAKSTTGSSSSISSSGNYGLADLFHKSGSSSQSDTSSSTAKSASNDGSNNISHQGKMNTQLSGTTYTSASDLFAAIVSASPHFDKLKGARATVTINSLRKLSNGRYTFNDNSMQFVADEDINTPLKNGQTVTLTIDRVNDGEGIDASKDWFSYGVFFSDLQVGGHESSSKNQNANAGVNNSNNNGNSGATTNSNGGGFSSSNNGGGSNNGTNRSNNPDGGTTQNTTKSSKLGTNGNSNSGNSGNRNLTTPNSNGSNVGNGNGQVASQTPTASSLPQTNGDTMQNRGLAAIGLGLVSMLVLPIKHLIGKKD